MIDDPFGNLTDWGFALDTLSELADNDDLCRCQAGLVRMLRYKGNWRLREEVLKRVGTVQCPSKELIHQVIAILDDDNIYYDARILAGNALVQLLNNAKDIGIDDLHHKTRNVIVKLKSTPQPQFFDTAIDRMNTELAQP